jgi:hypothetical protein
VRNESFYDSFENAIHISVDCRGDFNVRSIKFCGKLPSFLIGDKAAVAKISLGTHYNIDLALSPLFTRNH